MISAVSFPLGPFPLASQSITVPAGKFAHLVHAEAGISRVTDALGKTAAAKLVAIAILTLTGLSSQGARSDAHFC